MIVVVQLALLLATAVFTDASSLAAKQAIRLNPDYEFAHYNLGIAYHNIGWYQDAVETLKQAVRLKPSDPNF